MQIDASIQGKITHYGVVGLNVRRHCRRLAGLEINQELPGNAHLCFVVAQCGIARGPSALDSLCQKTHFQIQKSEIKKSEISEIPGNQLKS